MNAFNATAVYMGTVLTAFQIKYCVSYMRYLALSPLWSLAVCSFEHKGYLCCLLPDFSFPWTVTTLNKGTQQRGVVERAHASLP